MRSVQSGGGAVGNDGRSPLPGLGAHHVVLDESIREPARVLVTLGIRHRASVKELLRSPVVFDWFDTAAEWMAGAGIGAYPSLFFGKLAHVMSRETAR